MISSNNEIEADILWIIPSMCVDKADVIVVSNKFCQIWGQLQDEQQVWRLSKLV